MAWQECKEADGANMLRRQEKCILIFEAKFAMAKFIILSGFIVIRAYFCFLADLGTNLAKKTSDCCNSRKIWVLLWH